MACSTISTLCYWTVAHLEPSQPVPQTETNQSKIILVLESVAHLSQLPWNEWCNTLIPKEQLGEQSLILLRISLNGEMAAIIRHNYQWQAVSQCELSGAQMLRVSLEDNKSIVMTEHSNMLADAQGRYSRIAGALEKGVLQRIQQSLFAIVGAGRTGSLLAHSLTRMGASVLIIEPDIVELHNLDGDLLLPVHEGTHKADALQRALQPLVRSGATVQGRVLDIVTSQTAGRLLMWADIVISTVDNDAARMAVAAWCSALLKPHLDIGVAIGNDHSIGTDIRLIQPEQGCLACVGGFSKKEILPELVEERIAMANQPVFDKHSDFRQQRAGSLRSINQIASHLGLRLVEQLYTGLINANRYIRFEEESNGLFLQKELNALSDKTCDLCGKFCGQGAQVVNLNTLKLMALTLSNRHHIIKLT